MKLPPGLTAQQFAAGTQRLAEVVGQDWVLTTDEDVETYRDAYSPLRGEPEELIPCGAVAPESTEQVQRIVKIANDFKIPLWPISTGKNLGYGGAAPRMTGTMMLDLKRMNQVLEVNEPRAYALVEPGVSYFDFYRHLREHNLKLWLDCPDPGWGSMIGNAMDHGVGHTPMRDHFGSHCGMEVVLPNGDLLRTGTGSIPGTRGWQTFSYGYGPHISPMFGQSNFGIVTKMGFSLLPAPEASRNDLIGVPRHDDIHAFLDIMSTLACANVVDSSWSLGSPLFMSSDPEVKAAIARSGGEPSAELERLAAQKRLGYWGCRVRFYGAPAIIDAKWEYTKQRLSAIPGVMFEEGEYFHFPEDTDRVSEAKGDIFAKAAVGIPNLSIFSMDGAARNGGHTAFSPIVPMSGEEVLRANKVFRAACKELGMQWAQPGLGGWSWYKRNMVLLFIVRISEDPAQNKKMRSNIRHLIKLAAENGWGEYRTPPIFMDDVMAAQSFNNHALLRFHETIKDALDPNGILGPGRSGIWPKRFRTLKGALRS